MTHDPRDLMAGAAGCFDGLEEEEEEEEEETSHF
jgi:hypothetical protein